MANSAEQVEAVALVEALEFRENIGYRPGIADLVPISTYFAPRVLSGAHQSEKGQILLSLLTVTVSVSLSVCPPLSLSSASSLTLSPSGPSLRQWRMESAPSSLIETPVALVFHRRQRAGVFVPSRNSRSLSFSIGVTFRSSHKTLRLFDFLTTGTCIGDTTKEEPPFPTGRGSVPPHVAPTIANSRPQIEHSCVFGFIGDDDNPCDCAASSSDASLGFSWLALC